MRTYRLWLRGMAGLTAAILLVAPSFSKDEPGDELVQMVVNLLGEKDKDLRAVGLDQVRTAAKGAASTQKFAAQLPKLMPAAQAALLSALADRGDAAARPAVLEILATSKDESVRVAAIVAIGALGGSDDLPALIKPLADGSTSEKGAARASLEKLRGDSVPGTIATEMKKSPPPLRVALIEILTSRRALSTVPEIVPATVDDDSAVRVAAMSALGQMASPEHISGMLAGVLKATKGTEREAAEKAVALACSRIEDANERAAPVLAAWAKYNETDQLALLSTIGRVGGSKALAVVEAAMASDSTPRREAGLRALCNWPDATIADKLLALAEKAEDDAHRAMTFQAFVRVGSLRDKRTDLERLERIKQAMAIVKSPEERTLVINRCRAAYVVESLRYVLPYMEQPQFAQIACETIVELAHHRELREPNKVEFDPALDKVMKISKDAVVVDRADRYKKGQTWAKPKPPGQ